MRRQSAVEAERAYKERKREERRLMCEKLGIPFRTHRWRNRKPGETSLEFRRRWWREYHAKHREERNAAKKISMQKRKSYYQEKAKEYREKNKGKIRAYMVQWKTDNLDRLKKMQSDYVKRNRARITKRQCEYIKRRCSEDLDYKLRCRLRGRIWSALKDQTARKAARAEELLGCSMLDFRAHLQSQFTPEMTWDNYGSYWHVDHKRPLASFDLTNPEEQKAAFHYTNCQPLEGSENIRKGAKLVYS